MIPKLKTLIISPDTSFFDDFLSTALSPYRFNIITTTSISDAKKIILEEKGLIGSIFFDISEHHCDNPIEEMVDLRSPYFPEVILCMKTTSEDDKTYALPIIEYIRGGACNAMRVPTYDSEIQWLAKKAATTYLTRKKVVESLAPDHSERMNEFFNLVMSRKEQGLPISYNELELFFLPKNDSVSLQEILSKVNTPPIEDYKNTTILIVEDEEKAVQQYKRYLDRFCYSIVVAGSGKETLQQLNNTPSIDIVILDVRLGDTTGDELISIIKEKHPKAEIIMVTAYTEFDLIINTLQKGAFDFLVKGELDMPLINQKIIQALHKRLFEDFVQNNLTVREVLS